MLNQLDQTHRDFYMGGEYSKYNEDWHDEDGPIKATEIGALLKKNQISFRTCADVGCGTGRVMAILASLYDADFFGYEITDIPSERTVQQPENVKLIIGDFFSTSELSSYDLIMLNDVVEHIPDFFSFLNKVKLYSRYLVIRIPIEINVLHTLTNRHIYNRRRVGHLHYFSKDTALATVEECGLRVVDWQYAFDGLNMPHTSRSFLKLALKIPRLVSLRCFPDLGVRLFGGAGVLILAQNPLWSAEGRLST